MLPLVEKAAGRRFRCLPSIKVVEPKELVPIVVADITSMERKQPLNKPARDSQRAVLADAWYNARRGMGYHSSRRKTIYIISSNLSRRMRKLVGNLRDQPVMERMMVAHELVHALQDQHLGFASLRKAASSSLERASALNAVLEGHAYYIEERVLELCGQLKALKDLRKLDGRQDIYNAAVGFIAQRYKKGGSDGVWQVIKAPPATTSMLFHPETYSPTGGRLCDFDTVMRGLETGFGLKNPKVEIVDNGEWTLRQSYHFLDPGLRGRLFAKPVDSRKMYVDSARDGATIIVYVILNSRVIPEFVDAVDKQFISSQFGRKAPIKVERGVCRGLSDLGPDFARRYDRTQDYKGKSYYESWVFVAKGSVLVRILGMNLQISDQQVRRVVEQVFHRVPPHLLSGHNL
jgi:hypothetical protein